MRGAWIEIAILQDPTQLEASLPVRGAWIEISDACSFTYTVAVAPSEGSED